MTTPWTDVPSADSFDEAPEADVGGGALSVRELIAQLARTEDQIRMTGQFDGGSGPEGLRQLLRQQDQLIAELRRRRAPCPREDAPVEDA
jgi:hypothetical protein